MQPSLKVIIFSKDRPMQLEALLRTFKKFCSDYRLAKIYILYKTTNEFFLRQYMRIFQENPNSFYMIPQKNFRKDLLTILLDSQISETNNLQLKIFFRLPWFINYLHKKKINRNNEKEFILYLVDDTVFVREFALSEIVSCLSNNKGILGFSLRLGSNTTYCYPLDKQQLLPNFIKFNERIFIYNWTNAQYDFGYPFELSSSIYRANDIIDLLPRLRFNSPNSLESKMAQMAKKYSKVYPYHACYQISVAFSIPINRVQSDNKNKFGERYSYNVEELNKKFENGEIIDTDKLAGFIPNSCHQEIEISFKQKG